MTPLRILHVIPQIGVGGAERQLLELIVRSDRAVVEHQVLYYNDARDTDQMAAYQRLGVAPARVPRNRARPWRFIRDLAAMIRAARPDVVHCWMGSGAVWGRFAAMLAGARNIIVVYRGTRLSRVYMQRLNERLTGRRVHYMSNSRACARIIAEQLHLVAAKFHVVYNGVDASRYQVPSDRAALLSELGLPDDRKLVVTVARLTPVKDYPTLLRAARRCRGQLPVRFLIVGHGELDAELRAVASQWDLDDTVHFLGLRHDIPRILRSSDLFCFTSLSEGFPNALLEAMAAGLPIVTTDFPGAEEVIDHGSTGFVVRSGDDEAVYSAIRELVEKPDPGREMGDRARQRAQGSFSMEAMVRNTLSYYRTILNGSARPTAGG